jgi:hypothetical protein
MPPGWGFNVKKGYLQCWQDFVMENEVPGACYGNLANLGEEGAMRFRPDLLQCQCNTKNPSRATLLPGFTLALGFIGAATAAGLGRD